MQGQAERTDSGEVARMSAGRAAALVAAGLVAATLTACSSSVSDEDVRLVGVRDAYVRSGATERPAAEGEKLAKGDRVRTAEGGAVTLTVRDRKVTLGGDTHVAVPDGATVELARGALLVDRRRGPGLTVRAGDATVDEVGEGALRIERSLSVAVSALSADARVRTATGDSLDLDALYSVVAAGRALPGAGLPLNLRHDAWERSVVPDLLADDDRLNDLADGLQGPGAPVVPATFRPVAGVRTSEVLLAEAIARAARADVAEPLALRRGGGSWGVVARLLDTDAARVATALTDVLSGAPSPSPDGSGAPGSTPPPGTGPGGGPVPSRTPSGPSPTPSPGRPTTTGRPDPSRPPTSAPPSESEEPNPVEQIVSALPTPLTDPLKPLLP